MKSAKPNSTPIFTMSSGCRPAAARWSFRRTIPTLRYPLARPRRVRAGSAAACATVLRRSAVEPVVRPVDGRDHPGQAIVRRGPDDSHSRPDRNAFRHVSFAPAVSSCEPVRAWCACVLLPLHGRAPEHPLVRSSRPLLQMEHRALAPLRVDCELQVQATLLEHLHPVADPVVAPVFRRAHAGAWCADEAGADRQPVSDLRVEAVAAAEQASSLSVSPLHGGVSEHPLLASCRFGLQVEHRALAPLPRLPVGACARPSRAAARCPDLFVGGGHLGGALGSARPDCCRSGRAANTRGCKGVQTADGTEPGEPPSPPSKIRLAGEFFDELQLLAEQPHGCPTRASRDYRGERVCPSPSHSMESSRSKRPSYIASYWALSNIISGISASLTSATSSYDKRVDLSLRTESSVFVISL